MELPEEALEALNAERAVKARADARVTHKIQEEQNKNVALALQENRGELYWLTSDFLDKLMEAG